MQSSNPKQVGVGVYARFRPCSIHQHLKESVKHNFEIHNAQSVEIGYKHSQVHNHLFHLDMIFKDNTTQEEMFKQVGEPIVRDVLYGYNGTIFAYGQTGSGKTHSLFGDMTSSKSENRGIIPRACEQIFDHIENANNIEEVTIKCSFIEIYKEKLQDLLNPNNGKLRIRENINKSIYVDGIHEEYVSSFKDVFDLLQIGFRNRVVASTLMNQSSSRSHCVLTLNIKQTLRGGTIKVSKVNFADLAGSEKIKKTGATGELLEQAKSINLSLSTLGNVISALTQKKKGKHIPYRDSKLTYLLQDSLGGNTKTSLIVTCSSEKYNFEESINTLRFAKRAKEMKNKVTVNKQLSVKELQVMVEVYKQKLGVANATIQRLQKLIMLMRSPQYDSEQYGPQIDQYLVELAKIQAKEAQNSPKFAKPNLHRRKSRKEKQVDEVMKKIQSPQATLNNDTQQQQSVNDGKEEPESKHDDNTNINEQEREKSNTPTPDDSTDYAPTDDQSDDGSTDTTSTDFSQKRTDVAALGIIENLNETIDSKDKEIEQLNEEIKELRAKTYSQQEQLHEIEEEKVKLEKQLEVNHEESVIKQSELQQNKQDDTHEDDHETQNIKEIEIENKFQEIIDEQLQEINSMKLEKEQIETDRKQLLLWNQALQQKLDSMNGNASDDKELTSTEIKSIESGIDELNVSEKFEHQLSALKQIMSRPQSLMIVDDIKNNMDEHKEEQKEPTPHSPNGVRRSSSSGSGDIEEHKLRAQQTSLILYNLEKKLAKLPELNTNERRDLVDAAVTSIRCLLDSSLTVESELQKQQRLNESVLSSNETAEIELLKAENEKLIRKLEDMKKTWIAHLDMLMSPGTTFNDDAGYISVDRNDIPMAVASPRSRRRRSSIFGKKRKNKFVKPIQKNQVIGHHENSSPKSTRYGLKNLIGFFSGALLQYFGQVAVLKGGLMMCNKRVSLVDFNIQERDWSKIYVVLTKTELLGYRSLLHAETDTKSPLFQLGLMDVVSVLKIEEVLSAMAITSPIKNGGKDVDKRRGSMEKDGVYILTTVNDKYVFKAEGNLSREVWIENIETLLSDLE